MVKSSRWKDFFQLKRSSRFIVTLSKKISLFVQLHQIQMYKRKDNDIFGTSNIGYAPRIQNHSFVDPHAAFKKKTEENYEKYISKVSNTPQTITSKPLDSTKVNQSATFEDSYHKNRKEQDLQSSIFYPPTPKPLNNSNEVKQSRVTEAQKEATQSNFGRKETLNREINKLPCNNNATKGNTSRLFDLDERVKPKTQQNIPLAPLIPHQMQWDQHDSIKYAHINNPSRQNDRKAQNINLMNITESNSTVFNQEDPTEKKPKEQTQKQSENLVKKVKSEKEIKKVETKAAKESVEIKILKGWDYKLMEGLSKHCKLNGASILKFQVEEGQKATLLIKRSERWQNVTDWLRKDAKLRIRVINP